jgi:hypothetical protein
MPENLLQPYKLENESQVYHLSSDVAQNGQNLDLLFKFTQRVVTVKFIIWGIVWTTASADYLLSYNYTLRWPDCLSMEVFRVAVINSGCY